MVVISPVSGVVFFFQMAELHGETLEGTALPETAISPPENLYRWDW